MKLYFMKQQAVDYIKSNIGQLYINYYREKTNKWIYDLFDYEPFEFFVEIPDFELMPIAVKRDQRGETEIGNCKLLFENLKRISESQAADERFWAGLCNGVYYEYCRKRWDYDNLKFKDEKKDAENVLSRFFFSGGMRAGCFRNTLAKCWWVGRLTYRADRINKYELLDYLGPRDFATKVSDLFYSNTFSSNPNIVEGICNALKLYDERGIALTVKDHIRPTMQYLNALGGGLLLDAYTKEEIEDIVFDYIEQLYSGKVPIAMIDDSETGEDEEINFQESADTHVQNMRKASVAEEKPEEEETDPTIIVMTKKDETTKKFGEKIKKLEGNPTCVEMGCSVLLIRESDGRQIEYNLPKNEHDRKLYGIEQKLLRKKLGDKILSSGSYYIIQEISW
ncbi:MAG: hypothetical protein IJ435_04950 [Clostridia bacterium]|nr:hypothetical protein [Clostridia bacterium]